MILPSLYKEIWYISFFLRVLQIDSYCPTYFIFLFDEVLVSFFYSAIVANVDYDKFVFLFLL